MNEEHAGWLREGVESWNRRRKKIKFVPALSELNFYEFLPPDFRATPKTSRYFEKIDLSGADLRGSDLSDLNFSRAKFKGANLRGADLSRSNFQHANFKQADLTGVKVVHSHFNFALFEQAILSDVNLEHAELSDARFIESALSPLQMKTLTAKAVHVFDSMLGMRVAKRQDQGSDQPKKESKKKSKNQYDVFYATNRNPIFELGKLENFGSQFQDSLSYGVCEVIVPEGHRIGQLGSPIWKRLFNLKDDRLRREHIIWLDEELFWKLLTDTAMSMPTKQTPTVFVHGYRTNFNDAVIRSAQLGHDLGIGQGIGLFSWPSKGKLASYSADEASAEASSELLAGFIADFVAKTPEKKVNIIAHSMGCRCLVGALAILSNGRTAVLKKIEQVILAAADVDTRIMPNHGKHVIGRCKRVTSYVSEYDKALKISGWLHEQPRVGFSPPTFVLQGMDTVIVNDRNLGDFAHGYFASSRDVIKDVFDILKKNSAPEDRHSLVSVTEGEAVFWKMKN